MFTHILQQCVEGGGRTIISMASAPARTSTDSDQHFIIIYIFFNIKSL